MGRFVIGQEMRLARRLGFRGALGRFPVGTRLKIVGIAPGDYDWEVVTRGGTRFWVREADLLSENEYQELLGVLRQFHSRQTREEFCRWVVCERGTVEGIAGEVKPLLVPAQQGVNQEVLQEILEAAVRLAGLPAEIKVDLVEETSEPFFSIRVTLDQRVRVLVEMAVQAHVILCTSVLKNVLDAAGMGCVQVMLFGLVDAARRALNREVPWIELVPDPECQRVRAKS